MNKLSLVMGQVYFSYFMVEYLIVIHLVLDGIADHFASTTGSSARIAKASHHGCNDLHLLVTIKLIL